MYKFASLVCLFSETSWTFSKMLIIKRSSALSSLELYWSDHINHAPND